MLDIFKLNCTHQSENSHPERRCNLRCLNEAKCKFSTLNDFMKMLNFAMGGRRQCLFPGPYTELTDPFKNVMLLNMSCWIINSKSRPSAAKHWTCAYAGLFFQRPNLVLQVQLQVLLSFYMKLLELGIKISEEDKIKL